MTWIYIAAAIFGGGFLIPALLGGLESDVDMDFDTDVDLGGDFDVDTDFDADIDADVESDTESAIVAQTSVIGDWVASLLTFRTLIFVSAFFGIVGIVFTALGVSATTTLITSILLGLFAGVLNARLMAYLTRTDPSGDVNERHLAGSLARVVLPVGDQQRGRVEVDVAGQPLFMVARPYRAGSADLPPGEHVVVVEVKEGTAFVMSAPELKGGA